MLSRFVFAFVLLVAVRADAARSQSLGDAVFVAPGASCLQRERLIAHVKMWLGRSQVDADLRVRVSGEAQDPQSVFFDIEQAGETRRRVFSALPRSCDDVHAVLGFALALAIDAARLQREWLTANPQFTPTLTLGVQASAAYSVLPEAALGVQTNLERSWATWFSTRADLFSLYTWNQRIAGSTGRFDVLLAAASLQACAGGWPDVRLRVGLCAGVALGLVHAWGQDYAPDRAGTALWLAARSGVRFELHTHPLWILDLDVISNIRAPEYRTRGAEGRDFTRAPDAAGFLLSVGPAFAF